MSANLTDPLPRRTHAEDALQPRRRALFIAPQPFLSSRGSPLRVRNEVTALAEIGYDVDLLVLPFGQDAEIAGVSIHRTWRIPGIRDLPIGPSFRKIVFDTLLFLKAAKMVARRRYDVIHGVEEAAFIACALSRVTRTPFVFDMHSWMSEQLRTSGFVSSRALIGAMEQLECFCVRRAAGVITVADRMTDAARRIAPTVRAITIEDLPLRGVSAPTADEVSRLRESLRLNPARVLLYTGNFEKYQGIDLLIESFARFCAANPSLADVHLVLVGGGGPNHPRVQSAIELAARLGLNSRIRFVGERPVDEMGAYMALADALVSSRTEGDNTPLKIYTYMLSGKPIVATRITSHTQILNDDIAYLGDPEPEAFAAAMTRPFLTSDAALANRRAMVSRAHALAEDRFSWSGFVERFRQLYTACMGVTVLAMSGTSCAAAPMPQLTERPQIAAAELEWNRPRL